MVIEDCTRMPINHPASDPFFRIPDDQKPEDAWQYSARIQSIADSLWELRHIKGFRNVCKRLAAMDLTVSASELFAAALFKKAGFDVRVRHERGKEKQDFDFIARHRRRTVNVEVSTINTPAYRPQTVENTLKAEMKQLPEHNAAVVFLALPESWFVGSNQDVHLEVCADAGIYMETHNRLNAVINLRQEYVRHADDPARGSTGTLVFGYSILRNVGARHKADALAAFANGAVPTYQPGPSDLPATTYAPATVFGRWVKGYWDRSAP